MLKKMTNDIKKSIKWTKNVRKYLVHRKAWSQGVHVYEE